MSLLTNIVAYWKLDESSGNAADATGNGFTLTNNASVTYGTGLIHNGVACVGGVTQFLSRADNLGITNGNITMALWIKLNNEIASGQWGLAIKGDAGTNINYIIVYQYNGGTRRIVLNRQQQNLANNETYYNIALGTSGWHQIVLTYDGTNIGGYVDTVAVSNVATTGDGSSGGANLTEIGRAHGYTDSCPDATLDEVPIYSRVLSSGEVGQLYNGGAGFQYPFTASANSGFFTFR